MQTETNALIERLKMEAQAHACEAKTQRSTVYEIYQICSGATGERGDWHGAQPVIDALKAARDAGYREGLEAAAANLAAAADRIRERADALAKLDGMPADSELMQAACLRSAAAEIRGEIPDAS